MEASMLRRHENEALELKRRYEALNRLERRELGSFSQIAMQGVYHSANDYLRAQIEAVRAGPRPTMEGFDIGEAYHAARDKRLNREGRLKMFAQNRDDILEPGVSKWRHLREGTGFGGYDLSLDAFRSNGADITSPRKEAKSHRDRPQPTLGHSGRP